MKIVTTIAFALLLAGLGCSEPEVAPPYTALTVGLSASGTPENPRLELSEYQFASLEDLEELDGTYARVYFGGTLTQELTRGSVVFGNMESSDGLPLRYNLEKGVIVPKDFNSLVMLSSYRALDELFLVAPEILGNESNMQGFLGLHGKLELFYEPLFVGKDGDIEAIEIVKTNAFYLPFTQQLAVAQRGDVEQIPLGADPSVLVHESGHRLFDWAFMRDTFGGSLDFPIDAAEAESQLTAFQKLVSSSAVAGLNEGFADFLAFTVFGVTDPLALLSKEAKRNFANPDFSATDNFESCPGSFYCYGTLFAASLYSTLLATGGDVRNQADRVAFMSVLVAALRASSEGIEDSVLFPVGEVSSATDAELLSLFFHDFLLQLPADIAAPLCTELATQFGPDNFSSAARLACPQGVTP